MEHYILKYSPPRKTFATDATEKESQAVELHFEYLKGLLEQGTLVLAGRTDDAEYGIAIFKAENEAEAQKIVANDPAVIASIFEGELKLFRLALLGQA